MSAPQQFIRKPLMVEAMQVTEDNPKDICDWMNSVTGGAAPGHYDMDGTIIIQTTEGDMRAPRGDYVVREPNPIGDRQFYPVKPSIFAAGYAELPKGVRMTFADFRAKGLLWLVNKALFHPRGFAMDIDDDSNTCGIQGDGNEPWSMWSTEDHEIAVKAGADPEKLPPYPIDEDERFATVQAFFAGLFFEAHA